MSVIEEDKCPVCAEPFVVGVDCSMDIELGVCHEECLRDSPMVDLETGEEKPDGKLWVFPYESGWCE